MSSCEWEMISVKPSKKNSIASVTTNDAIPTYAWKKPLIAPMMSATTSERMRLGMSGIPALDSLTYTNGVNSHSAPIDRSISPSVITNTCPAAMIARKQK